MKHLEQADADAENNACEQKQHQHARAPDQLMNLMNHNAPKIFLIKFYSHLSELMIYLYKKRGAVL